MAAPQSPDLTGLASAPVAPQSPDLTSLSSVPTFGHYDQHGYPPPHQPQYHSQQFQSHHQHQGSFDGHPSFAYQQQQPPPQQSQFYDQPFHSEQQHQHMMAPVRGIKPEPDQVFQMNGAINPNVHPIWQQQQPQHHQIKSEHQSDPTLGVNLKTSFPVARIKRIMQADEDVGKVAQVTPHVVSRALELFMIKLIAASAQEARGGAAAGKGPRRVLAQHMKRAVLADNTYDFLAEIVGKVPDAPAKGKKEVNSDSEDAKPKKRGKKRKDSGDDY